MDSNQRQFTRLARHVLDGIGTDADRDELAQLVQAHPELIAGIVDELMIDALLKWQSGNISEELPPVEASVDAPPRVRGLVTRLASHPWLWATAATLLVATGLATWQFSGHVPAIDSAIADIVAQNGVTWADGSTALVDGTSIVPGRLSSTSGEYTLQFRRGPTVRVVGATSMDIKSKMLVQLDHGQATASVPENSIGFTISSPFINVIDQGTQFGIAVADGRADVIVFDGKVDLKSKTDNGGSQTRLIQGEGVRVDRQGSIGRLVDVRRDVHGRWWAGDDPGADRNVIARVTDNIWGGGEKYVCYQTTYRALQDDSLAYADNPYHQWNGLTADGLPEFLRGADYIKTFNDYRYLLEFQMTIELSKPAMLYVFADNRIPPPKWLKDQFEDTGVDIGLDEGPWLTQVEEKYRQFDKNTVAKGSGKSIDNVFSVWRRRCVDGAPVTLGNAGEWHTEGGQGRAMYGIAATPLAPDVKPSTAEKTNGA